MTDSSKTKIRNEGVNKVKEKEEEDDLRKLVFDVSRVENPEVKNYFIQVKGLINDLKSEKKPEPSKFIVTDINPSIKLHPIFNFPASSLRRVNLKLKLKPDFLLRNNSKFSNFLICNYREKLQKNLRAVVHSKMDVQTENVIVQETDYKEVISLVFKAQCLPHTDHLIYLSVGLEKFVEQFILELTSRSISKCICVWVFCILSYLSKDFPSAKSKEIFQRLFDAVLKIKEEVLMEANDNRQRKFLVDFLLVNFYIMDQDDWFETE